MPSLRNIAEVLRRYAGRYQFLDAFVDDVDELRDGVLVAQARLVQGGPAPRFIVGAGPDRVAVQVFPDHGVARCRLDGGGQQPPSDPAVAGAVLGGLIGTALATANDKKEGLLGGLVLGMLVGSMAGAAARPPERVLAMEFDPSTADWRLYDGPLLRWAKRTLQPPVPLTV